MKRIHLTVLLITSLFQISSFVFAIEPFQNPALSSEERAGDLLSRLTLAEKVGLMMDQSHPVERLGIKPFHWWNEALHGVARAGLATVFPQPIGLAATFDPQLIEKIYTAVSDEARAKNTRFVSEGSFKRYQGLSIWTPTINIFRDPRWGRGIETYGEDPYLTGIMGVAVVKGLQGPEDTQYDKAHACAKHFAVHSGPEWNRHSFNAANISKRDLYETYLPAFKALVKDAGVKEVMCAYNRFEDEPCCGSKQLLHNILRNEWKFKGIVVADCGAIADFYRPNAHLTHPDAASASADGVRSGTDVDCGSSYRSLTEAVEKGLISENEIDISVRRLLKARFELGEMDDPALVSWTKIPYSVVASEKHNQLAFDAAASSITLLMNKNNILPLKNRKLKLAVMGPNAHDSVMQWGNYNGTPRRTITLLDGIRQEFKDYSEIVYEKGCEHVEKTLMRSSFNLCRSESGQGFSAKYWNNPDFSGDPVSTDQMSTPFKLCTSGATVFAPGVSLTNFSARYNSTFYADKTGEVSFDFYSCGLIKLKINGKEVRTFKSNHGANRKSYLMQVENGKSYDIELDFSYIMGDAQLNFDLGFKSVQDIDKIIRSVQDADIILFAGGISPQLEGEEMGVNLPGFKGGDRTDIELPEIQRNLIKKLHQAGKKIIFINCSGSPIGLVPETETCEAIIQAWYPGQSGGKAVAEVLSGKINPSGKLPVTFYSNLSQLPDFENYNMAGRTYRYMQEKPLFPFGFGLSYTSFGFGKIRLKKKTISTGDTLHFSVKIKNTGKKDGEEVIQVYLTKNGDKAGPVKTLRAFKRIHLSAGKSATINFSLSPEQLEWWNEEKNQVDTHTGEYTLSVGKHSGDEDMKVEMFHIR